MERNLLIIFLSSELIYIQMSSFLIMFIYKLNYLENDFHFTGIVHNFNILFNYPHFSNLQSFSVVFRTTEKKLVNYLLHQRITSRDLLTKFESINKIVNLKYIYTRRT